MPNGYYSSQSHHYSDGQGSSQHISHGWGNNDTTTGQNNTFSNSFVGGGYGYQPEHWATATGSSHYPYVSNSTAGTVQKAPSWDSPQDTGRLGPSPQGSSTMSEEVHDYRALVAMREEDLIPSWLREAMQNGKKVWECRKCGNGFARKQHGYYHVLKQHFNQDKLFECRVCKEQFNSENSARRHRDHQQRRFSCTICHKVFARPDYCRLHQQKCQQRYL